jgi:hypothetical protein
VGKRYLHLIPGREKDSKSKRGKRSNEEKGVQVVSSVKEPLQPFIDSSKLT